LPLDGVMISVAAAGVRGMIMTLIVATGTAAKIMDRFRALATAALLTGSDNAGRPKTDGEDDE
jgi:hypothetical protein